MPKIFYVDGIADVEHLGVYFKMTFFSFVRPPGSVELRLPVVTLIRPVSSLLVHDGAIARWMMRKSGSSLKLN
jgi:hypothetical protein